MKKLFLLLLLYSVNSYADCINVNGEIYCKQNTQTPSLQYTPQQLYIPNIPYYPPPVYQQPQVITAPQITPGNPNLNFEKFDTGRVIKRREN